MNGISGLMSAEDKFRLNNTIKDVIEIPDTEFDNIDPKKDSVSVNIIPYINEYLNINYTLKRPIIISVLGQLISLNTTNRANPVYTIIYNKYNKTYYKCIQILAELGLTKMYAHELLELSTIYGVVSDTMSSSMPVEDRIYTLIIYEGEPKTVTFYVDVFTDDPTYKKLTHTGKCIVSCSPDNIYTAPLIFGLGITYIHVYAGYTDDKKLSIRLYGFDWGDQYVKVYSPDTKLLNIKGEYSPINGLSTYTELLIYNYTFSKTITLPYPTKYIRNCNQTYYPKDNTINTDYLYLYPVEYGYTVLTINYGSSSTYFSTTNNFKEGSVAHVLIINPYPGTSLEIKSSITMDWLNHNYFKGTESIPVGTIKLEIYYNTDKLLILTSIYSDI